MVEDESDSNMLLWIALGAALVYFFMRRSNPPPPSGGAPRLPAPKSSTPGIIQNSDGSLTVTEPPLPEISVPSYSPGGNVSIPGESYGVANPFGLPPDDFTSINQG